MSVKLLQKLAGVSLLLLLIVLIAVLCIVWTMPDNEQIDADTEICLKYDNKNMKCGKTTSLLHEIFEKEISSAYAAAEKREKIQTEKYIQDALKHDVQLMTDYKNTLLDMKPSAKLVGNREEQDPDPGNNAMTTVTSWRHDKDLYYTTGFQRYGIRYQNGRLIVPVSGTYYIYSFLGLTERRLTDEGIPVESNKTQEIKHALHKYNVLDTVDTEIASNMQSRKNASRGYFNYYASQIATLVKLRAGDEISVKLSDVKLLKHTGNNYFGLHLI
ncbi:tumor necrosis factor ligand superfamily member 15-like [Mya arenaria]|uniref:tumor necrosis factor ligand superfamily member 15-like n=1 Tax=Mya arenaria TaxID=6604 RepID=UPI0022E4EF4D|nr:tumor necrosis factor ligand superfamily member 15-like [Mya arenaria]